MVVRILTILFVIGALVFFAGCVSQQTVEKPQVEDRDEPDVSEVDRHLATPNQREMFSHVHRHFVQCKPTECTRIDLGNRDANS